MLWQPWQRSYTRAPQFSCYLICCHSACTVAALRALTISMMCLSSSYPSLCPQIFFILRLSCSCPLHWKRLFFLTFIPSFPLCTSIPNITQSLYLHYKKFSLLLSWDVITLQNHDSEALFMPGINMHLRSSDHKEKDLSPLVHTCN